MDEDRARIWSDWRELVTIAPAKLAAWLKTDESKSVGWSEDGGESVGHQSGARIVEIRKKRKSELTDDEWSHMAKVVAYIKRHAAQGGPAEAAETSRWRYSLMNWGHDPLKGKPIRGKAGAAKRALGKPKTASRSGHGKGAIGNA